MESTRLTLAVLLGRDRIINFTLQFSASKRQCAEAARPDEYAFARDINLLHFHNPPGKILLLLIIESCLRNTARP